jgi:hypothetical protein
MSERERIAWLRRMTAPRPQTTLMSPQQPTNPPNTPAEALAEARMRYQRISQAAHASKGGIDTLAEFLKQRAEVVANLPTAISRLLGRGEPPDPLTMEIITTYSVVARQALDNNRLFMTIALFGSPSKENTIENLLNPSLQASVNIL